MAPQPSSSTTPRRRAFLGAAALLLALAPPLQALDLRFTTENDLLTDNPSRDDLYTFAVALEARRGPYTFSLRENAFTDRAAARRFDETHLGVGRALPTLRPWSVHLELGVAHVGRGLLGQDAQNAVHRLIGGEELDLPYVRSSLHPRLALTAERWAALGERLEVGPRLEADSVPGLRSLALAAAQARFEPHPAVAVHILAGARWSHADLSPLEPHLAGGLAAAARLGLVLDDRILVTWSYNDYGDEREHWSLGYRVGSRRRGRSPG